MNFFAKIYANINRSPLVFCIQAQFGTSFTLLPNLCLEYFNKLAGQKQKLKTN
jgi:hypothetical protein